MDTLLSARAALRYEFLMQIRRRSIWLVLILVSALSAIFWQLPLRSYGATVSDRLMLWAEFTAWFLPVGVGLVLADRLARDRKLRVEEILDTFSGSAGARLLGKYLGSLLATLVPVVLIYLLGVGYVLATFHDLHNLPLALAAFAAIPLPAMLFAAGLSVALPAILKVPLYQVLFIGYWFWANLLSPRFHVPTLTPTMLNATGPWAEEAFFHFQWAFLVLHPAIWQGIVSIILLVGLSLLALLVAWLYQGWERARR